jgi:hypothetical protein
MPAIRSALRFLRVWVLAIFWGRSLAIGTIKTVFFLLSVALLFPDSSGSDDGKVIVSLSSSLRWNFGVRMLIGAGVILVWLSVAFGVAWVKYRRCILVLDDKATEDGSCGFRVKVSNRGLGSAESRVYIKRIVGDDGKDICAEQLPQEVPLLQQEDGISNDIPGMAIILKISHLNVTNQRFLAIPLPPYPGVMGPPLALCELLPGVLRSSFWIHLLAKEKAGFGNTIRQWYFVEPFREHHYKIIAKEPPFEDGLQKRFAKLIDSCRPLWNKANDLLAQLMR